MGERRSADRVLMETSERRKPLGRSRHRWKVHIKIFKKWGGGMDCIDLAHDSDRWRTVVNAVTNLRVTSNRKIS
jgi:hypothetical protein